MLHPSRTKGDTEWFVHDRFGMFIHWGTYAAAARHEWVKHREEIADADYMRYFDHFDPDLYDPAQWARAARDAGMKYLVVTSKHHEGFCLWDSKYTDYKATNTPYARDLLRPMVDAFKAAGLKVGFYYSLLDWHHPQFPIDGMHSMRNHPDALEWNKSRDVGLYAEYMRNQVRELLTEFGKIDIMWFDFSYPSHEHHGMKGKGRADWHSEELLAMVRELQPGVIVDNRLDLPSDEVDIHTPEQVQPREWIRVDGKPVVWEACQTFSGSWGYYRDEYTWKAPQQLIRLLVDSVSTGGNLLMNVGPTARGTFDPRAVEALGVYRDWMRLHSRAIYGCTQSRFTPPADARYTQNGNRLYLHVYSWPFEQLHLDGLAGNVEYAQLLNDASEVRYSQSGAETLTLRLPVRPPDVVVPVVEIFLSEPPGAPTASG